MTEELKIEPCTEMYKSQPQTQQKREDKAINTETKTNTAQTLETQTNSATNQTETPEVNDKQLQRIVVRYDDGLQKAPNTGLRTRTLG